MTAGKEKEEPIIKVTNWTAVVTMEPFKEKMLKRRSFKKRGESGKKDVVIIAIFLVGRVCCEPAFVHVGSKRRPSLLLTVTNLPPSFFQLTLNNSFCMACETSGQDASTFLHLPLSFWCETSRFLTKHHLVAEKTKHMTYCASLKQMKDCTS